MGLAISGIRKTDNTTLYFRDNDSFNEYVKTHHDENVEFAGLAQTNIMTKVIDMNVDRQLLEGFVESCGIDKNAVKYEDMFTDKDVDVEQTAKRIEENRKKAKKVILENEDGSLQDTDENPEYVQLLHSIVDMKHQMQLLMFTAKSFNDTTGYNDMMNKINITEATIDAYFEEALNMDMSDVLSILGKTETEALNKQYENTKFAKFKAEVEAKTEVLLKYVSDKQAAVEDKA
jgi:hypothetical protein